MISKHSEAAGHVHGKQRALRRLERAHVPRHCREHPVIDGRHDVVAFGCRDELIRRDQLALLAAHAHHDFVEAADAGLAERLDRLVHEFQPVLLDRARDLRDPAHLAMPVAAAVVVIELDAVATAILGRVAGHVGGTQQRRGTLDVGAHLDHADARADRERRTVPAETMVADGLPHRVGDAARLLERAIGEQHAELIAAEARDHVTAAHACLDQARDLADQPVAGRVAAGVVDELELVEVDVQ